MKAHALALLRAHIWKVASVGVAMAMVMALAVTSAQASGDPFGDSSSDDGGLAGDASAALGAPDGVYVEVGIESANGGSITVFLEDSIAFNGPGGDILVHAVAAGTPASATIEVSADGATFVSAGIFADTSDASIDLGALGLSFATAVRVTYASGDFAGYNLDAVAALNGIGEDAILNATPDAAQGAGFTTHTVTAHLTDDGLPIQAAPVRFRVISGPNSGEAGVVATNASGNAAFTYMGDGGPGVDLLAAWLDIDGNEDLDAGELSDIVTMEWHGVTGAIELEDLDGGQLVVGDEVRVTVEDRDLDTTAGPDTVAVIVTSTTAPVGFSLTLTETGNSTGVFRGTFTLGEATDAATRVLAANADDEVTGTYDDGLDGEGNDPAPVNDSLTVRDEEEDEDGDREKVTVCHMPPGNPGNAHTITIGAPAVEAHLSHGDVPGNCDDVEDLPPTKQQQALERFCERKPDHHRCDPLEAGSSSASEQRGRGRGR